MRITEKKFNLNEKCAKKKERYSLSKISPGQWNQILSGAVCVVGFSLIFALMLIYTIDDVTQEVNTTDITAIKSFGTVRSCTTQSGCIITFNACNIPIDLDEAFNVTKCDVNQSQTIVFHAKFKDNKISEGWLTANIISITILHIYSTQVVQIQPNAFTGLIFNDIKKLRLDGISIKKLQAELFAGLGKLEDIHIENCNIESIEENALYNEYFGLEILLISVKHKFNPTNITGKKELSSLKTVVFGTTPLYKITNEHFKGLIACVHLSMVDCKIDEIENEAFESMRSLQTLELNKNLLTTLPGGIRNSNSNLRIFVIDENLWDCSCSNKWLQDYLYNKIVTIKNKTICASPISAKSIKFFDFDFDFCEDQESTTTTISSTTDDKTDSTVSTTSEPSTLPENFTGILCSMYAPNFRIPDQKFVSNNNIQFPQQNAQFSIKNNDDGTILAEISSFHPSDILLWFREDQTSLSAQESENRVNCLTNLLHMITITNLSQGDTYTFCLVRNSSRISPLDCRAHITTLPWAKQAWLMNRSKTTVIGAVSSSLILCCISGAIVVYLVVRGNPSLLRGSKRVVMVKHRAAQVIVMPPKFKNDEHLKVFEEKKIPLTNKRNNFRRSVSETSIMSNKSANVSYISAVEPTPVQLLHWRLERLRGGIQSGTPLLEVAQPSAPPSPVTQLNHKLKEKPSPTLQEYDSLSGILGV